MHLVILRWKQGGLLGAYLNLSGQGRLCEESICRSRLHQPLFCHFLALTPLMTWAQIQAQELGREQTLCHPLHESVSLPFLLSPSASYKTLLCVNMDGYK